MLELSPLETAANASARSMPAFSSTVLVEADAGDLVAVEVGPSRRNESGFAVDDGDGVVAVLEAAGERRTDAAAAHDHDVHGGDATPRSARPRSSDARPRGLAFRLVGVGDVSKRILLGRKLRSAQLGETLLPKRIALPVFASDALSSVAYAPDEVFIMLARRRRVDLRLVVEGRRSPSPS